MSYEEGADPLAQDGSKTAPSMARVCGKPCLIFCVRPSLLDCVEPLFDIRDLKKPKLSAMALTDSKQRSSADSAGSQLPYASRSEWEGSARVVRPVWLHRPADHRQV
jgi:hypothetical protein